MSDARVKTPKGADEAARARLRGRVIRAAREAMGENQVAFSKACRISARTLSKVEAGVPSDDVTPAFKIARHLGGLGVTATIAGGRLTIALPLALIHDEVAGLDPGQGAADVLEPS